VPADAAGLVGLSQWLASKDERWTYMKLPGVRSRRDSAAVHLRPPLRASVPDALREAIADQSELEPVLDLRGWLTAPSATTPTTWS
jgi:hypothetical protein